VVQLLSESVPELFIALEVFSITCLRSELLAGLVVESVVKSQLEDLRDVEVSCQDICLVAPRTCLYAAG